MYLDPGAGSLILQALIAGLIAIPFVMRNSLKRAYRRVVRSRQEADDTRDGPND